MGSSGSLLAEIQPPIAEAKETPGRWSVRAGFGREVEFSLCDKAASLALEPEPWDSRSG
jgi:hypothetical protein